MARLTVTSQPEYRLSLTEKELGVILSLLGHTGSDTRSPREKSNLYDDLVLALDRDSWPENPLPYDLVPHEKADKNPGTPTMVLVRNPNGRL